MAKVGSGGVKKKYLERLLKCYRTHLRILSDYNHRHLRVALARIFHRFVIRFYFLLFLSFSLLFQMNATFINRTKLTQKELDVNVTDSFPELWVTKAGLQFEVNTFQVRQLRILCIADLFQVFSSRTEIVLTEERPKLASILYTRGSASCKYIVCLSFYVYIV